MAGTLICIVCGGRHKARSDKFPCVLTDKKNVKVGYICKKCAEKYRRSDFVKQHKIKPGKDGRTLNQMIRDKIQEIKAAVKISKENHTK